MPKRRSGSKSSKELTFMFASAGLNTMQTGMSAGCAVMLARCNDDDASSWMSTRLDVLGQIFTMSLAFYLVYGGYTDNPTSIGFILTVAGA